MDDLKQRATNLKEILEKRNIEKIRCEERLKQFQEEKEKLNKQLIESGNATIEDLKKDVEETRKKLEEKITQCEKDLI